MRPLILSAAGLLTLAGLAQAQDPPQVEPKAANADAPLPPGFPDGTRPGTIEVKHYPAYRGAVVEGQGMTTRSGDMLFWALFRHISKKDVAMTAPVINTYRTPGMIARSDARGDLSMEFPYPRPDQGEAGPGVGTVKVVDHPSQTVVALGLQGEMNEARMREGMERLQAWLDEHKAEWTPDGPPRRLGYHGPMTPTPRRLWEIQVPIRKAEH